MDTDKLIEQLKVMEKKIDALTETQNSIGHWISEEQTKKLTGLSKSTLYNLRKSGVLSASSFSEKKLFYKKTDLEEILKNNEAKQ